MENKLSPLKQGYKPWKTVGSFEMLICQQGEWFEILVYDDERLVLRLESSCESFKDSVVKVFRGMNV